MTNPTVGETTMTDFHNECPDCGTTDYRDSTSVTVGCAGCARRHPEQFAAMSADQAAELDELRRILVAAESWFLSIQATETPQEADLAIALRRRNPQLGVNRGIRIKEGRVLPADEHHYGTACDDRPYCEIPKHHALEDMS